MTTTFPEKCVTTNNHSPKNDSTRQAIEKRFYKKGVKLSFCSTGTTYKLSR